jgi:thioredoxin 1
MKWITAVLLVLLTITASAKEPVHTSSKEESRGIKFHTGTWEDALQKAVKEGKPIFLDISASWCGPCKMLKANTFPNEEVGEYFNANFVNVAVDGEIGEGVDLATKYHIRGYPTMIFLDSKGEVITQITGYRDAEGLIESGKQILSR